MVSQRARKTKTKENSRMDINAKVRAIALEQDADAEMNTPPARETADDTSDIASESDVPSEGASEEDTATLTQTAQTPLANFTHPAVDFTPQDHRAPQHGGPLPYTRLLRFILNQEDRARFVSQLRSVDARMATAMANLNDTRAKINAQNATWTQLNSTATPSEVTMAFFHAATAGAAELGEFTSRFIHPSANEQTALKFSSDFVALSKLTHKLMGYGIAAMNLAYEKSIIVQNITAYVDAQRSSLYSGLEELQQSVSAPRLFQNTQ